MKLQDVLNDRTRLLNETLQERGVNYERCRYRSVGSMPFGQAADDSMDAYRALHDVATEMLPFGSRWPYFADVYAPEYLANGEWVQADWGCDYVYVGMPRDRYGHMWYAYLFNYGDQHGGADLDLIIPIRPPYPDHCND